MMTTETAENLIRSINRYAGEQPVGKLESHDLESLSSRILAPRDVVEKLLAEGVLRSEGPVHAGDETGLHSFKSDDLNEIRRAVLSAIACMAASESTGDHGETSLAAGLALRNHVDSFEKRPDAKPEFSRFPAGLVQLSSPYDEEQQGPFERAATTAAKVAGVGAAGYGAAALLRGRMMNPSAGLLDQLKTGSAANIATAGKVMGTLSAGAQKVAAVLAGKRLPTL